jgi:hypothetical protein
MYGDEANWEADNGVHTGTVANYHSAIQFLWKLDWDLEIVKLFLWFLPIILSCYNMVAMQAGSCCYESGRCGVLTSLLWFPSRSISPQNVKLVPLPLHPVPSQ